MKSSKNMPFGGDFGPHKAGKPVVPDRIGEFIWLGVAALSFAAIAILTGYVWIALQMPEATWSMFPMVALAACFIWLSYKARKKRIEAAEALAKYEAMLDGVSSKL